MIEEYNKTIQLLKIQKENIFNLIKENKDNIAYIKEATNAILDIDNKIKTCHHIIEKESKTKRDSKKI